MSLYTTAPRTGHQTLLYAKLDTDLDNLQADIAVLGMPFGTPYSAADFSNDQTNAPAAIRQATDRVARAPGHYDFDIDGPLLQGRDDIRFVDCGDIVPDLAQPPGEHYARAEAAIRRIAAPARCPSSWVATMASPRRSCAASTSRGRSRWCISTRTWTGGIRSTA